MVKYILKAKNLYKSFYQDSENLNIIEDLSYSFDQGKIYSVTGESGTGKSTLLNLISGIDIPTKGEVFLNDLNINNFNAAQKNKYLNTDIGIVFQEPFLIKELTILENVMLKGLIAKINYDYCQQKAYDLLSKIGLKDKALYFPSSLSVGQQQRISVLRAIFNNPKFLIADEPTANLDKKTKVEITNLLIKYKTENNMGLIIATHDNYIINLSDKILNLNN